MEPKPKEKELVKKETKSEPLEQSNELVPLSPLTLLPSVQENNVLNKTYSYMDIKRFQSQIEVNISELAQNFIIKSESSIVNYLSSESEILKSKQKALSYKVAGSAFILSGLTIPLGMQILGLGVFGVGGVGLWGGIFLFKKGTMLYKEPRLREFLNGVISTALTDFDEGNHTKFLETLSKEFTTKLGIKTESKSLLRLDDFEINASLIIDCLLEHDFRPDGIAYLLNLIGESLISGHVKIKGKTRNDLSVKAKEILNATNNEKLKSVAKIYDDRIHEINLKSFKRYTNSFFDSITLRSYSELAKEFINDSQKMPFCRRLNEMSNIALLNMAIICIMKDSDDEISQAKELLRTVRDSIKDESDHFISFSKTRLEIVEDFISIISSEIIEEQLPLPIALSERVKALNNQLDQSRPIENAIINDLNKEFEEAKSHDRKIAIQFKKADYYQDEAIEKEKNLKLNSLRSWKDAEDCFRFILKLDPSNRDAAIGFARCMLMLAKYKQAIKFLRKNSSKLSKEVDFWLLSSIAHQKQIAYDQSQKHIVEALKLDPKNVKANNQMTFIEKLLNSKDKPETKYVKDIIKFDDEQYYTSRHSNETPYYRILSIDGGGIRGIMPALWLCEIERKTRRPISHLFNMLAGTSTGGIIAAGLATPFIQKETQTKLLNDDVIQVTVKTPSKYKPFYSSFEILQLYRNKSKKIFASNNKSYLDFFFKSNIVDSKYTNTGLSQVLDEYFEDTTLDKALTELVIPTTCVSHLNQSYVFTRREAKSNSDKNETFKDVLMASTAAPTFFPSHAIKGKKYVDGGVTLNNPTMKAYITAIDYGVPKDKIHIISMGTGNYIPDPFNIDHYQGSLFWAQNLYKVCLPAQEGNTEAEIFSLLGNKYDRWQVWLEDPILLDDVEQIDNLLEIGRQYIEEMYASEDNKMNKLLEFLETDKYQPEN